MNNRSLVKYKICQILRELAQYRNRTDMYIHVRSVMGQHLNDDDINGDSFLSSLFNTSDTHKMQFKRVLFPIQSAIDWAYNIFNTLLAVDECRMLEYSFSIVQYIDNGNPHFFFNNFHLLDEQTYERFLPN